MTELMRFDLGGGGSVLVEVNEEEPGIQLAARDARGQIETAAASLGAGLSGVRDAAAEALRQFRSMDVRPDEVEIEFGVRLNAEAGAVIAKSSVEGHLQIRLTWSARSSSSGGDRAD